MEVSNDKSDSVDFTTTAASLNGLSKIARKSFGDRLSLVSVPRIVSSISTRARTTDRSPMAQAKVHNIFIFRLKNFLAASHSLKDSIVWSKASSLADILRVTLFLRLLHFSSEFVDEFPGCTLTQFVRRWLASMSVVNVMFLNCMFSDAVGVCSAEKSIGNWLKF